MAMQHLLFIVVTTSILHAATSDTVYDILDKNNLPRGLILQGVQSYKLHESALEVTFPRVCDFFIMIAGKQYKFRYGSTVGGVIKSGSISNVYGVRMQMAFAWLGFVEVTRTGDQLKVQLETSTQSFPVSAFMQSPSCQ